MSIDLATHSDEKGEVGFFEKNSPRQALLCIASRLEYGVFYSKAIPIPIASNFLS